MRIKQSICFPMMQPLPVALPAFIERVAKIGYAAVEIWKPDESFSELYDLAQQHGLRIASFSGHDSLAVGFNDPAQHERICDELQVSIDIAAKHSVPGIIVFSGNRRAGQSEGEAIAACVEGLRKIAPYAEEKGVNLNMELLNSRVDHPGYQCDHSAWGLEVVRRVNSPRVKLLYDIYHMQIMEGNIIQTIKDNLDAIGYIHIADVPGRFQPGTGEINFKNIFKVLREENYQGMVGFEFEPVGKKTEEIVKEVFESIG